MGYLLSSIVALFASIFVYLLLKNGYELYRFVNPLPPCPIVQTMDGAVQGLASYSRDGRLFYQYLGVPYAKAPVGEFRFESPQRVKAWSHLLKAEAYGSACPQYDFIERRSYGREDCLFVNVFSPKVPLSSKKAKQQDQLLPVMVFVHGGGFMFGSGGDKYQADYFMDEDIVLVTFNYRVGSLGFLSTGDGEVRGNMGLKDQALLLKWVQANIASFGGNPQKVTVFGESAGGASVHLHLLSPMSRGLFHKAIVQSGDAISPFSIKSNPVKQAEWYAAQLNCTKASSGAMVECLKMVPVEAIIEMHEGKSKVNFREPISFFGPTIEVTKDHDTFLNELPHAVMSEGRNSKVPLMIGYNSHEGLLLSTEMYKNDTILDIIRAKFSQVIPSLIFYPPTAKVQTEMARIKEFYFGGKNQQGVQWSKLEEIQGLTHLYTDWLWALGIQETASLMAKSSQQVYAYYYTYEGNFQLSELILAIHGKPLPPELDVVIFKLKQAFKKYVLGEEIPHLGAGHADELGLLFKVGHISNIRKGHRDYQMSKELVKVWVAFGNINEGKPVLKFKNQVWSPLERKAGSPLKFLNIDVQPKMIGVPNEERIKFLSKLRSAHQTKS